MVDQKGGKKEWIVEKRMGKETRGILAAVIHQRASCRSLLYLQEKSGNGANTSKSTADLESRSGTREFGDRRAGASGSSSAIAHVGRLASDGG